MASPQDFKTFFKIALGIFHTARLFWESVLGDGSLWFAQMVFLPTTSPILRIPYTYIFKVICLIGGLRLKHSFLLQIPSHGPSFPLLSHLGEACSQLRSPGHCPRGGSVQPGAATSLLLEGAHCGARCKRTDRTSWWGRRRPWNLHSPQVWQVVFGHRRA